VEQNVQQKLAEMDKESTTTMAVQLRRLERAYQAAIEEEVSKGMQAISRSPGPHEDYVWEAAAQWSLAEAITMESADFVVPYLEIWGFAADGVDAWRSTAPRPEFGPQVSLGLEVTPEIPGHEEHSGHTWYLIDCHVRCLSESNMMLEGHMPQIGRARMILQSEDRQLKWRSPRRLHHLRENLHDPVKAELGDQYAQHFAATPFASHGAPKGTTAKLAAWLGTLAELTNNRALTPRLVARSLVFFRGPALTTEDMPEGVEARCIQPVDQDWAIDLGDPAAVAADASAAGAQATEAELYAAGSIVAMEEDPGPAHEREASSEVEVYIDATAAEAGTAATEAAGDRLQGPPAPPAEPQGEWGEQVEVDIDAAAVAAAAAGCRSPQVPPAPSEDPQVDWGEEEFGEDNLRSAIV